MKRNNAIVWLSGLLGLPLLLSASVLAEGPTVSGYVDVGYNYNFNKMPMNTLRSFDDKSNTITLQSAEVNVAGTLEGGTGYRVDVSYGYDATKTHSTGFDQNNTSNVQTDIQQAYITAACPLTKGTFTIGKFVTPFGAEVIEAKDNYNTSRGLLFGYAIPFTHTGIKYDKSFLENKLSAYLGVTNGWDNTQDNNKGKTILGGVTVAPISMVSLSVGGASGPEQNTATPSIEKNSRNLVDTLLKVTPTDKLTLVANYDWGVEEGLAGAEGTANQNWQGLAAYANYAVTDNLSGALRWETLDDEGSRTGTNQVLHSTTATLQHKMAGVISRLEYRYDTSSQYVYANKDGMMTKNQKTIGVQFILPF